VKSGDVIAQVGGQPAASVDDIADALAAKRPGQRIEIELQGPSGQRRADVTLGELPPGR
jgi:S1-C subfamily serine protease